jgi:hypothetical protein
VCRRSWAVKPSPRVWTWPAHRLSRENFVADLLGHILGHNGGGKRAKGIGCCSHCCSDLADSSR